MTRSGKLAFWLMVGFQLLVIVVMVARKQMILLYGKTITLKTQPVDPHSLFSGDYARLSFSIHTLEVQKWDPWPPKTGTKVFAELARSGTSWDLVSVYPEHPDLVAEEHVVLKGVVSFGRKWSRQPIFDLVDVSSPGWLSAQPQTAPWRTSWSSSGMRGLWWTGRELPKGTGVYLELYSQDRKNWYLSTTGEGRPPQVNLARGSVWIAGKLGPYEEKKVLNVQYGIETYFIPEGTGHKFEKPNLDVDICVNGQGEAVVKKVRE